jgi:hypothetical protein
MPHCFSILLRIPVCTLHNASGCHPLLLFKPADDTFLWLYTDHDHSLQTRMYVDALLLSLLMLVIFGSPVCK